MGDSNAVRADLANDPTAYSWSSCAAYALGAANPLVILHPSYLGFSAHRKVRQRHYRTLLAPSDDTRGCGGDARDARHVLLWR